MHRRQTSLPTQWLIIDGAEGRRIRWPVGLPGGTGIIVINTLAPVQLRRLARIKGVMLLDEHSSQAVRVHSAAELRRALLRRAPVILLSPIHATASHPNWKPMPRMRVAALLRLGGRRLFALGGMNERRFRRVEALGFQGWAGISAFREARPAIASSRASRT